MTKQQQLIYNIWLHFCERDDSEMYTLLENMYPFLVKRLQDAWQWECSYALDR